MGLIGGLILKHLPGFITGVALFGALAYVEGLRLEVSHDKRALTVAQANLKTVSGQLEDQNKAVIALQAAGDAKTRAANAALAAIQAQDKSLSQKLHSISVTKAGTDQCKSSDALILGSL